MKAVSIIIPTYNVEDYIGICLDSILKQTMQDFEIIIIDDGSKDKSHEVALEYQKKYPDKIRAYKQENTGQGGARNKAVTLAEGEYILFVDSDDTVEPTLVEKTYQLAKKTDADMVIFNAFVTDEAGKMLTIMKGCNIDAKEITVEKYPKVLLEYPCPWNKLYRRSIFDNPDMRFPTGMWYEDLVGACIFLINTRKIEVLSEPLYYYMQRSTSVMHSRTNEKNLEILKAMDLIIDYFKKKDIYDKYYNVLESLGIYHVLIAAAGRCVRADKNSQMAKQMMEYMNERFPQWPKNEYMQTISKANKLKLWLLQKGWLGILHLLYKVGKTQPI